MDSLLPFYQINAATWFYLSLLLIVAVFLKFDRLWSLRNLDLILLLCISPAVFFIQPGEQEADPETGYSWVFAVTAIILIRLCGDALFKRRPRLEQNLNVPGMAFLSVATFGFLRVEVSTEEPPESTVQTVRKGESLLNMQDTSLTELVGDPEAPPELRSGPTGNIIGAAIVGGSQAVTVGNESLRREPTQMEFLAARILAILAHCGVIGGLLLVGKWHFGDLRLGLSMALLYLLLPCTAVDVGKVNHVLPAALIVWAFAACRRPILAGILMGLACGTLFFPVFLLPLWTSYYGWRKGLRFVIAVSLMGAVLLGSLAFTSADVHSFTRQVIGSIDWNLLKFDSGAANGFWKQDNGWGWYRLPVFVTFVVLVIALTSRPRSKGLEHLMAHSAAIVVGTQFWYPQQGGTYLLWYVPLLLLVVFRPHMSTLRPSRDQLSAGLQTTLPQTQQLLSLNPNIYAGSGTRPGPLFR